MSLYEPCLEGLNTQPAPPSVVEMLVTAYALIKELADDLESEVRDRYRGYPEDDRRFVRDMLTVKEARAYLARNAAPSNEVET